MSTVLASVLALVLAVPPVQQPSVPSDSPAVPKLRSESRLVLVPLVVEDKNGQFVPGLHTEDFTLEAGGKTRRIAIFDEGESIPTSAPAPVTAAPGSQVFSNTAGKANWSNPIVLVLDGVNSSIIDQSRARASLLKFAEESVDRQHPTALCLVGRNGLVPVFDFSTDPQVVVAALKRVQIDSSQKTTANAESPMQVTNADVVRMVEQGTTLDQIARAQTEVDKFVRAVEQYTSFEHADRNRAIVATLENLQQLAQAYRGIPGRKQVVWATAGFPFSIDEPGGMVDTPLGPIYQQTFELLNDANIAIYPVDIRGLFVSLFPDISICTSCGRSLAGGLGRDPVVNPTMADRTANAATLNVIAEITGGKAYVNGNDFDRALKDVRNRSAAYYMLGFYLDAAEKPGYHHIKIKTSRRDTRIRARNGYLVTKQPLDQRAADRQLLNAAFNSPVEFTGLPVSLQIKPGNHSGAAAAELHFTVTIPPGAVTIDMASDNAVNLQLMVLARDANGKEAGRFSLPYVGKVKPEAVALLQKHGFVLPGKLSLSPGEYSLRVLVRDELAQKTGSLIVPRFVIP